MRTLIDFHTENARMIATLIEELTFVIEISRGPQPSSRYRLFIRSAFSHFEAMVWIVKQTALTYAESPSEVQVQFANEVCFVLTDDGTMRESKAKTPFLQNLQFAFRFASEVFGVSVELDRRSPQWSWLVEGVKLRDAITHPKNSAALEVTQDQFQRVVDGVIWLMQKLQEVLTAIQQHSEGVTSPLVAVARSTIESTKGAMSDGAAAEEICQRAEAVAQQILADAQGAGWGQQEAIERAFEEAVKFAKERPDLGNAIPDHAIEGMESQMRMMFEQHPILARMMGVDSQAFFAKIEEIKALHAVDNTPPG